MDAWPVGSDLSCRNEKSSFFLVGQQAFSAETFSKAFLSFKSLRSFAMVLQGERAPPKKASPRLFTQNIVKRPNYRYLYHLATNLVLRC